MKPLIRTLFLALCWSGLWLTTSVGAFAGEAVDKEALRYNDAVMKLQRTFDEALAKEKAKSIAVIAAVAKAKAKANELAAAGTAWKAVLAIDDSNAEARKHFESLGQLDAVLAELKQGDSPADLLGAPATPATSAKGDGSGSAPINGKPLTISSLPAKAVQLGPYKAGTTLTFQYVSGTWTFRDGAHQSPDAKAAGPRFRLRVATDPTSAEGTLAVLPGGTAQSPYTLRLDTDVPKLYLMMNSELGLNTREGDVVYRVEIEAR